MSATTLPLDDALRTYLLDVTLRDHPELAALRAFNEGHPAGHMQVSPEQGQLMQLLVKLTGARRAFEVGVFTGYSALAVALAMPEDGRILACDVSEEYTSQAKPHWERAGVAGRIELVLAPARETLELRIEAGESGTYDFGFIDADKTGYETYYELGLRLLRRGGLMAFDNVLWSGRVAAPARDKDTAALQAFNRKLHRDERIDLAMIPIGDGLTLARKR
jgi:predicted O-methyltransferase YrrM